MKGIDRELALIEVNGRMNICSQSKNTLDPDSHAKRCKKFQPNVPKILALLIFGKINFFLRKIAMLMCMEMQKLRLLPLPPTLVTRSKIWSGTSLSESTSLNTFSESSSLLAGWPPAIPPQKLSRLTTSFGQKSLMVNLFILEFVRLECQSSLFSSQK